MPFGHGSALTEIIELCYIVCRGSVAVYFGKNDRKYSLKEACMSRENVIQLLMHGHDDSCGCGGRTYQHDDDAFESVSEGVGILAQEYHNGGYGER